MQAAGRKPNYFVGPLLLTILAAAVAGVLALVLSVGAKPAEAAFQGANGKIAFASARADNLNNFDIWVMNDDGTNPVQLTNDPLPDVFPAWSPDGKQIAFVRFLPGDPPNGEVYVMDANGKGERNLTNNPAVFEFKPDWSPDGKQIASDSDRDLSSDPEECGTAVHTMRSSGVYLRRLTDLSLQAFSPAWSPEGEELVFSDNACRGESDLFVMKVDGTGVTQLFESPENETHATWSPNNERIAFERLGLDDQGFVPGSGEIYVIGKDGEGLTNLTNSDGVQDEDPDWAPEQDKKK